jgi:prepilin peptidase CpaA
MHTQTYLDLALITVVVAAAARDLAVRRIPNRLLGAGLLCAASLHLMSDTPLSLLSTGVAGFATGLALFLPLYLLRGMAAGDVKLMATVGAFTGPLLAFHICLVTCCIGGVMALIIVICRRRVSELLANLRRMLLPLLLRLIGIPLVAEPQSASSVGGMPYGLAIALGSLLMLGLGQH